MSKTTPVPFLVVVAAVAVAAVVVVAAAVVVAAVVVAVSAVSALGEKNKRYQEFLFTSNIKYVVACVCSLVHVCISCNFV